MSKDKAEELLQGSKDQDRMSTEPAAADDDSPDVQAAMVDAFAAILEGDASSNSTVRDENLAALLRGLEDADELEAVVREANEELDREYEGANRNEALKALVRVGLREVRPEVMETAKQAKQEYVASQEDEF